jgi:hypothetical protein
MTVERASNERDRSKKKHRISDLSGKISLSLIDIEKESPRGAKKI